MSVEAPNEKVVAVSEDVVEDSIPEEAKQETSEAQVTIVDETPAATEEDKAPVCDEVEVIEAPVCCSSLHLL
jgi:hypothetical protein